jgi:AcrR family transcriptional regulator
MNEIANAVGIKKASLYSHYAGKDELFLAVFEDVTSEYRQLFERLLEASNSMEIQDKLRYHFEGYILYFYRNPEMAYFLNQSLLHVPSELYEKLRSIYLSREKHYRKRLEDIFKEGIQQRIIREGDPTKKVWSFKTKRDGVIGWLLGSPDVTEEHIREFWDDFWFGAMERNRG